MKRVPLLVLAFAPILLMAFILMPPGVEIGKPVPDFSLKGIDGKAYKLSDLKGKTVVLEWTNPNCPFVQRVYRSEIMTSLQKKYANNVVWLTVNSTNPSHDDFETPESLSETYKKWNAAFSTMLLDPDGKVGKMFDAKTTPHMFVIDKEGKLAYAGAIDDDPRGNKNSATNYVDAALTNLLAGKPVEMQTSRPYGCSVKY